MSVFSAKKFPVLFSGTALTRVMPLLTAAEAVSDIVSNVNAVLTTWEMADSHRYLCESDRRDLTELRRMIAETADNISRQDLNLCLHIYRKRVMLAQENAQRRIGLIGRKI